MEPDVIQQVLDHGSQDIPHRDELSGLNCELQNEFVPSEHTSEPRPPYEKRQSLLLTKVNDHRKWAELDDIVCERLKELWPVISKKPIDDVVIKYEEIVHHTIQ